MVENRVKEFATERTVGSGHAGGVSGLPSSDALVGPDWQASRLEGLVPESGRPLDYDGLVQLGADCLAFLRAVGFLPLPVITHSPVEIVDVEQVAGRESTIGSAEVIRCYCPAMFYIGSPAGLAITGNGEMFAGLAPVLVPARSQTYTDQNDSWRVSVTVRCDAAVVGLPEGSLALACDYRFKAGARKSVSALFGPPSAHVMNGCVHYPAGQERNLGRVDALMREGLRDLLEAGFVPSSVDALGLAGLVRSA